MEHESETFTAHWQPAFRPNILETSRPSNSLNTSDAGSDPSGHSWVKTDSAPAAELRDVGDVGDVEDVSLREEQLLTSKPSINGSSIEPPQAGMSFAGQPTVFSDYNQEELESDEDGERLDPAWGIRRTDTSQILQKVTRTSSFPDFASPLTPSFESRPPQLPTSQAEQLMRPDSSTVSPEDKPEATRESLSGDASESNVTDSGHADDGYFDQSQRNQAEADANSDEQARYEEGLPLISTEPSDGTKDSVNEQPEKGIGSASESQPTHDETSFFDHHPAPFTNDSTTAPQLDRKNTADVFQSLHFSQADPPDSPVRIEQASPLEPVSRHEVANAPEEPNVLDAFKGDPLGDDETMPDAFKHASSDDDGVMMDAFKGTASGGDEAMLNAFKESTSGDDDAIWKAALDDDEFLVDDPDDLLPDSEPGSPSSLLGSLREDPSGTGFQGGAAHQPEPVTTPKRDSRPEFVGHSSSNPYAPHQPSTSDLTQLSPTTYGSVGLTRPGLAPMNSFQQHLQQRPAVSQSTQCFVDQSKGGYKSPYDLPLDMSKSRRRPQAPTPSLGAKSMPPPPRTSSMSSDKVLQSPFSPTQGTFPAIAKAPSAMIPPKPVSTAATGSTPPQPGRLVRPSSSTFFEELPITQRARPPTGQGRFTPQQNTSMPPPQLLPRSPPRQGRTSLQQPSPPPPQPQDPYAQYQLRPPERLDPFANVPLQATTPSTAPAPPNLSTRYSPAPVSSQLGPKPSPSPRYSPAPPSQPAQPSNVSRYTSQPNLTGEAPAALAHPNKRYASQPTNPPVNSALAHQPRTSSPLAYHGRPPYQPVERTIVSPPPQQSRQPPNASETSLLSRPNAQQPQLARNISNVPQQSSDNEALYGQRQIPPRRSQTQSPSKQAQRMGFPLLPEDQTNRPASVHAQMPQIRDTASMEKILPPRTSVRQRGLTQTFNFVEPVDGQQHDPLQRWKGAPVFRFGFGGSYVSCFPRHTPRYGREMSMPMIKPGAGEVKLQEVKHILPTSENLASFPGPLRTKSKKKELLSWMTTYISMLEQTNPSFGTFQQLPDPRKRHDEKILLWKIVRAFVEHDGVLDNTGADARMSLNSILSPEIFALEEAAATQYREDPAFTGIYQPAGKTTQADPINPAAVENIRKHLLRGEREQAVWHAVDHRLWAHALLISSTLDSDRTIWKQVVQEFVRQEVKVIGANTESLAAVYEIFAGNLEESIDEIVPPSARAGLQMVSKVDSAGPTKNALDGLDKWRETIAMVLNNRRPDDAQALAALGRLLASYGRVEASQICQIFSRGPLQPNIFGGADEPQASIVLLGVDHRADPTILSLNEEAILLTEIFEFATSIQSSASTSSTFPYLQAFKLQRAISLAEIGSKAEAQAYCDAIAGSLKTSTKVSPYFHPALFKELDELSNRLKQIPIQSSSWIAKPSIEKVSGSVWNKFSSFVAGGEDSDADSKGSGRDANPEVGPFAKVTGTPSLSRSGSQTDLYGSYPAQPIPNTIASSRYAPNGLSTARSSSELTRGRASLDSQRSPPSTGLSQSYQPMAMDAPSSVQLGYSRTASSPYEAFSQSPPRNRYQATPPQTSYMPNAAIQASPQRQGGPAPYVPTPPPEQQQTNYMPTPPPAPEPESLQAEYPVYEGYSPAIKSQEILDSPQQPSPYDPSFESNTQSGYKPHVQAGYEPSTQSYAYEPPADTGYVPYQPDPESDNETGEQRPGPPTKKSFVDDDGDDFSRISNSASTAPGPPQEEDDAARRRANDAAADAAFKAAAEADAAREKEAKALKPKGSGWLGGLWGGGKKSEALDAAPAAKGADAKVHRAHLGEKKMTLRYDEKIKKWVDDSNPDSIKEKAATPPPPRMGGVGGPRGLTPSMSMPAMGAGGIGQPNRVPTPNDGPPPSLAGITGAGTPPPGHGPPSRPATGMGDASSIDDLLGGPAAGGRRTVKGKKGGAKGRYIDVMAK